MLPQSILDQFARIPHHTTLKNKYYGVFNLILTRVAFTDTHFVIEPQYPLPQALGAPIINPNFIVTYVVEVNQQPVFFLEIKPALSIDHPSSRVDADTQMRVRFRGLYDLFPTPRLHGISVMGERLAFYCMDKPMGRVHPDYVAPSKICITDTVPAERWDTDITTEEGYQKFMAVIDDVKEMAAAL
jgi:hypothetical protein